MNKPTEFLPWLEEYNLGIELIDDQHKKLVDIINGLYESFYRKDSNAIMAKIFSEMEAYAQYHFATEENYFKITMYKFEVEHTRSHNAFRKKTKEFKAQFESGQPVSFRLINYLKKWLSNHILREDKLFVPILKKTLNLK
jgi:hemerythrin